MTVHDKRYVTPEEYLTLERAAETKSEYLDGEIIAMTGASRRHSLVTANLLRELGQQLKGRPCEGLSGDMRIWVPVTGLYTYADSWWSAASRPWQTGISIP